MKNEMIYAIDFGTSNSLLAGALQDRIVKPIPIDPKHSEPTVMRSTMYFSNEGSMKFGHQAIQSYLDESGEGRFIRSVKKFLPNRNFSTTQIGTQFYDLENIIGAFLREMKERADQHFQQEVSSVVLGRPARFSENDQEEKLAQDRLENAAKEAGFKNISFFPEPLAAAFDFRKDLTQEKLVLIVDLGGGTSDFTVLRLRPKEFRESDVLSLGGVSIAGDILDGLIMANKVAPHFGTEVQYRFPMSSNILQMPPSLKYRLMSPADITLMSKSDIMVFLNEVRKSTFNSEDDEKLHQLFTLISENLGFKVFDEIESCKRKTCTEGQGQFLFDHPEIHIQENLSLEEFSAITEEKIQAIFSTMDNVVATAGVKNEQVDLICCTGGTAKVPDVHFNLLKRFGKEKIQSLQSFHSVIQGLSERALDLF